MRPAAIRIALRVRAGDSALVCSHSRRDLGSRPTLVQSIERVLEFMRGSPTVHRDGRQFFLVLDLKESSTALYEELVVVLREYASRWSTAVGPGDSPRGMTVVVSGERAGLMARIPKPTLDSLCIIEGLDYSGRIVDVSPGRGRSFQWISIQHPGERGRVRALHSGMDLAARGVFNVRVFDCHGVLADCAAAGVEAVNADRSEIARLRALGVSPPATEPASR